jgi:hypothetical protein
LNRQRARRRRTVPSTSLIAEEDHSEERIEVAQPEHAADEARDERRDAEPEKAHGG